MVTGKNKEQFEIWHFHNIYKKLTEIKFEILNSCPMASFDFYKIPFEMQKGVYEAYYKEVHHTHIGIDLIDRINGCYASIYKFDYLIKDMENRFDIEPEYTDVPIQKKCYFSKRFDTFNEAEIEVFKYADSIINKKEKEVFV